ncbi:MAG: hypothetical protein ACRENJ_06590 [Candidatus Eiseniibacteriota bacterium]
MRHKRIAAAEARAKANARAADRTHPQAATAREQRVAADQDPQRDVVPWLLALGFSAGEARCAAKRCEDMANASLEQRVRVALSCFRAGGTPAVRAGKGCETAASLG